MTRATARPLASDNSRQRDLATAPRGAHLDRRADRGVGRRGTSRRSRHPDPGRAHLAMLIAGNWKMFKGPTETGEFCRALRDAALPGEVDVVACPPFVSLADAVLALAGTEIGVFAQNCHWAAEGAFTGEVSAGMRRELGVYGTPVGHSE